MRGVWKSSRWLACPFSLSLYSGETLVPRHPSVVTVQKRQKVRPWWRTDTWPGSAHSDISSNCCWCWLSYSSANAIASFRTSVTRLHKKKTTTIMYSFFLLVARRGWKTDRLSVFPFLLILTVSKFWSLRTDSHQVVNNKRKRKIISTWRVNPRETRKIYEPVQLWNLMLFPFHVT